MCVYVHHWSLARLSVCPEAYWGETSQPIVGWWWRFTHVGSSAVSQLSRCRTNWGKSRKVLSKSPFPEIGPSDPQRLVPPQQWTQISSWTKWGVTEGTTHPLPTKKSEQSSPKYPIKSKSRWKFNSFILQWFPSHFLHIRLEVLA